MDNGEVIQVGNIVDDSKVGFKNPQRGRIYSIEGLAPCLNCCGGGQLEPKIVVYEENTNPSSDKEGIYRNNYGGGYLMQVTPRLKPVEGECKREERYARPSLVIVKD